MTFPTIETARLQLTELQPADDAAVFELFSNESVVAYDDLAAFTAIEQARDLIGSCGFNSWSGKMRSAVIGYDLLPTYWGNGYGREAVQAIIEAAFSGVLSCGALNRIQADMVPGNQASEALLCSLGFKHEGCRRESGYWKTPFMI